MTETTEEATVSQDNGLSRSAGTPASAVSGDKVLLPHDHVKDMIPKDLQQQLIKALIPAGAFMTDDHRYYFNGEGPLPSVTTILEILDKPALTTWKQQKAASAMWRYIQGQYGSMPALASEDEAVKWALSEARKSRTDAAAIGSGVHHLADMVTRSDRSDSEAFGISDDVRPYLEAYKAFSDRYSRSSFVSSEKAVWSLNGYAGTYDLLMMLPCEDCRKDQSPNSQGQCAHAELWLLDIKTGKGLYPEFALQLAAYRWADWIIIPGNPQHYDMPHIQRTGVLHLRPDQYPDTGYRLWEYPTSYEEDYIPFLGLLEAFKWKQRQEKPLDRSQKG